MKTLFRKALRNATQNRDHASFPIHLICASNYIASEENVSSHVRRKGEELLQQLLIEFNVDSVLLTSLFWLRARVCSKEELENWYTDTPTSMKFFHDELDLFFNTMQTNAHITDTPESLPNNYICKNPREFISFAFRKLNRKESQLVDQIDEDYFNSYIMYKRPDLFYTDVTKNENLMLSHIKRLQLSESKSRFKMIVCHRDTILLRNMKMSWTREHQKLLEDLDTTKRSLKIRPKNKNRRKRR